jgi:hypothetical protein
MRLWRLVVLAPVVLLQGCFFVWIPGNVVGAVSDTLTGSEGEHCVSRGAQVGDLIKMTYGGTWKVESLSGTSLRCSQPEFPIRAKLSPH